MQLTNYQKTLIVVALEDYNNNLSKKIPSSHRIEQVKELLHYLYKNID